MSHCPSGISSPKPEILRDHSWSNKNKEETWNICSTAQMKVSWFQELLAHENLGGKKKWKSFVFTGFNTMTHLGPQDNFLGRKIIGRFPSIQIIFLYPT